MSEFTDAKALANRVLERPSADPDDDLATLSRQLLRALEREEKQKEEIHQWRQGDPMGDLINSNRDEILRKHEEAMTRVRRCLARGDVATASRVLDALGMFHPMHADWHGWPKESDA